MVAFRHPKITLRLVAWIRGCGDTGPAAPRASRAGSGYALTPPEKPRSYAAHARLGGMRRLCSPLVWMLKIVTLSSRPLLRSSAVVPMTNRAWSRSQSCRILALAGIAIRRPGGICRTLFQLTETEAKRLPEAERIPGSMLLQEVREADDFPDTGPDVHPVTAEPPAPS